MKLVLRIPQACLYFERPHYIVSMKSDLKICKQYLNNIISEKEGSIEAANARKLLKDIQLKGCKSLL